MIERDFILAKSLLSTEDDLQDYSEKVAFENS